MLTANTLLISVNQSCTITDPGILREETEKEHLETFTLYLSHQQLHDTSGSPVDYIREANKNIFDDFVDYVIKC